MNIFLLENAFDTKFFDNIYFINGYLSDDFEANFEKARKFLSDVDSTSTNFCPLSLYFKFYIMVHIIATALIPWKESLGNIIDRDIFVHNYLVKKIKINSATWIREYMLESAVDDYSSAVYYMALLLVEFFNITLLICLLTQ